MKTGPLHYYVLNKKYALLIDTHTMDYEEALQYAKYIMYAKDHNYKANPKNYVIATSREISI